MKLTKILLMTSLLFASFSFSTNDAFDYEKKWKEVEEAMSKGLPKTALEIINSIYDQSIIDKNEKQQLKATITSTKLVLDTEELGLESVIGSLNAKVDKSAKPVKQILQSMTAELFQRYYNNQYYQISQRTNMEDFDTGDIRTWAPNHYRDYITENYLNSVNVDLYPYKTEDYKTLLSNEKNATLALRPSLQDLLVDRALNYFSSQSYVGITPSFAFELDDAKYYSDVNEFIQLEISSSDEESKLYKAVLLFQKQLRHLSEVKDEIVLASYDMKRLNFVRANSKMKDGELEFEKALNAAANVHKGKNAHQFLLQLAEAKVSQNKYQEGLDLILSFENDEMYEHIKSRKDYLVKQINQPILNMASDQVTPRNTNFLVNINSRNLDAVHFKLVKAVDKTFSRLNSLKQEEKRALLESLPIIKSWTTTGIRKGYQAVSHEEIIQGLDYGKYFVIASNDRAFHGSDAAYVYTAFYVSDLAYSTYNLLDGKKIFVRDRESGKPVSSATVEIYSRKYNNNERKYNFILANKTKTNKEGWADVKISQNNSFSYMVINGDDVLDLERNDYHYKMREANRKGKRTEIFTDRAIYRPGQVIHFKTLSMNIDKAGLPSIEKNKSFSITLNDVNGQEVETIKLKSSDYGSASGMFTLPVGRLTGNYYLNTESGSKSIKVEEYKRPKFEVNLDTIESEIKLGNRINVTGEARALAGNPISDGKVSYTIMRHTYHGWWGWYRRTPMKSEMVKQSVTTSDASGQYSFEFEAEPDSDFDMKNSPTYSYHIKVDVTDLSGETRSTEKTINVAALPYAYSVKLEEVMDIDDLEIVSIKAVTTENINVESKAVLKIIELVQPDIWQRPRNWQQPTHRTMDQKSFEREIDRIGYYSKSQMSDYPEKKIVHEEKVNISKEGLIINIQKYTEAGKAYKIIIESDQSWAGHKITSTNYLAVSDVSKNKYPVLNLLYVTPETEKAEVGEKYEVKLGTSDKELTVFYAIVRDQKIVHRGIANVDNDYTICYIPKEKDRGGISLALDFVKHNYHERINRKIELPWDDKKLNVELITKRDKVLPGAKEEWTMKVSGTNKDKMISEVLATMYDASLDQFVSHSYSFNPYVSHYGNIQGQFFGFGTGLSSGLNYRWNQNKQSRVNVPVVPILKGIDYGYGGISIRGSRRRGTEMYNDGVRVMSKSSAPAPEAMMDEVQVVSGMAEEAESADYDAVTIAEEPSREVKEISVRKNLNESVFFYPNLKTDEEGNLLISFTMNEALTSWKLLTFAHDKDLRFGLASHEVKTQKDLMILPNAPRFLREGDKIEFPATVSNLSDQEIVVRADLELLDPDTDEVLNKEFGLMLSKVRLTVPQGETKKVNWSIQVPSDYKKMIKYRVTAVAGDHTDGEENILPVVSNQMLVTETKVISLKKKESKEVTFDALNMTSKTATPFSYTLEYTSNPVWYAIQALPYLMEYPHQCTEQIFNRMYANTMASHIANSNPRIKSVFDQWKGLDSDALLSNLEKNEELKSAILEETPWVRQAKSETEQKKRIALLFYFNKMSNETASVLEELERRQMPSGAFPWFSGGRENVYITQNIVEGIAHLHHLGIINEKDHKYMHIMDRALMNLDEQIKKRYDRLVARINRYGGDINKDHLDNLSIHYLYIRSFFPNRKVNSQAQEAADYYYGQAAKYWLHKGLYMEAMIGLVMKRSSNQVYIDISNSLKERSFYSDELGRYWNLGNGFNWHELPIESHAMLIEFFAEIEEEESFVEDMKIWLLKNKQTNHWKTTKATSAAIYSLLLQGENGMVNWISENNIPEISVGGKQLQIKESNLEAGTGYYKKTWSSQEIESSLANIKINNNNESIAWGAAYYQYFEELDQIADFQETPLIITRNLFKEEMTDSGPKLVSLEKDGVNPGDRIIVRIEIKVDRNMSYVHLKDMRGSGFEPENVLSGYRWKGGLGFYESTRDLASHFFISQLNKGTYVFEYPMRAVHKGEFSTGITTIQSMYAPEFTSHSNGSKVVVD